MTPAEKLAVDTGYWPLFRHDPRLIESGGVPLKLDSAAPKTELSKFMSNETRFGILKNVDPARAAELAVQAQSQVHRHYAIYQQLAAPAGTNGKTSPATPAPATPAKS